MGVCTVDIDWRYLSQKLRPQGYASPTETPLFKSRPFQMLVAGFLPFSAVYIELHYIFTCMWGHSIYTLFGILFFAFVLLVIVTSSITVSLLYFQLTREDHRWWWMTFINGGMIGLFI